MNKKNDKHTSDFASLTAVCHSNTRELNSKYFGMVSGGRGLVNLTLQSTKADHLDKNRKS